MDCLRESIAANDAKRGGLVPTTATQLARTSGVTATTELKEPSREEKLQREFSLSQQLGRRGVENNVLRRDNDRLLPERADLRRQLIVATDAVEDLTQVGLVCV